MSNDSETAKAARERMSALADGELDSSLVTAACAHWREDDEARAAWHTYHLIGDALRSEDLTRGARRDAQFLAALRKRLAAEPVVLAPEPLVHAASANVHVELGKAQAGGRRRSTWWTPAAVAAGFVAVAGAVLVTRTPPMSTDGSGGALAVASPASASIVKVADASSAPGWVADGGQTGLSGPFVRDARLDRYLSAHKQFAGSSAIGVPSVFLRDASAETAGR